VPERLVPRLKSTIEGLSDQTLPTRDLGELFMVMFLKRCEWNLWHRFDPSTLGGSPVQIFALQGSGGPGVES
jgi:hypothetical protein